MSGNLIEETNTKLSYAPLENEFCTTELQNNIYTEVNPAEHRCPLNLKRMD